MCRVLRLLLFCGVYALFALPKAAAQDLHCLRIDKSRGLPNEDVYDVFQDSKGFLWLTHEEGLCRYDGYEFRAYTCAMQTVQAGANIVEDELGRIWYQNFDGFLYYIDGDSLRPLQQRATVGYRRSGIGGGKIFTVQQEGIDVFDLRTLRFLRTLPFEMPSHIVYTELIGGKFYILTDKAIAELDVQNETWRYYRHSYTPSKQRLDIIKKGANGELMLFPMLSEIREAYALGETVHRFKFALPIKEFIQNVVYTGGCYWFCTADGVYVCDERGNFWEGGKILLKGHNITSVLCDREGNFWISTKGTGLLMMPDSDVRLLFRDISVASLFWGDSLLYVGGAFDDLYKVNLRTATIQKIYQGTARHELNILGYDSIDQHLKVQGKNYMYISPQGKVLQSWIVAVKGVVRISRKYSAVAASGIFGLQRHEGIEEADEWDAWQQKNSYSSPLITSGTMQGVKARAVVYVAQRRRLYYATSYGLFATTADSIEEIRLQGNSLFLRDLCEMGDYLYGYSPQGELYKVDSSHRASAIPLPNSPYHRRIQRIKVQGKWLFVQSGDELYYADGNSDQFAKFYTYSNQIKDFLLLGDRLILATPKGLLLQKFSPHTPQTPIAPIFHINSFLVDEVEQEWQTQPLSLAYEQNDIEIRYSILSFKTVGTVPMFYRINENAWQLAAASTRQLRLAALASGDYCVQFRLGSTDNEDPNANAVVCFSIRSPWWLVWWFWLLCGCAVFAVAYAFYWQQTQALKRRNTLLSEKFELEQNLNRSTLKAIKSQMNPHFFFNALNTLQSYIFSGDKRNALRHIANFSRLTRMVLDMSETDRVSLEEEIRSLQLYLELEKVRFETDDFFYEIQAPTNAEPAQIFIPPMLIQPYVENAIKHGLLHKEGTKKLTIRFQIENDFLCVHISDNGIGRRRAEEINKNRPQHRSFATQANQTRLQLISQYAQSKASIEFIDKYHDDGQAAGTDVLLRIPLTQHITPT